MWKNVTDREGSQSDCAEQQFGEISGYIMSCSNECPTAVLHLHLVAWIEDCRCKIHPEKPLKLHISNELFSTFSQFMREDVFSSVLSFSLGTSAYQKYHLCHSLNGYNRGLTLTRNISFI